ncbi:MAG: ATP-dependent DNA ligase [Acidimicrobiia bacterium]
MAEVVTTSEAVAATPARGAKIAALAGLLARLDPAEVEPVVAFLTGEPRQGRIGVGWATLFRLAPIPAPEPTLTVGEIDQRLSEVLATTGTGSAGTRAGLLTDLLGRATASEIDFLRRLLGGELRQGALEGVMAEAVARAAGVPAAVVRRAAMLCGDLGRTAAVALTEGRAGLEAVGLQVGVPLLPMLASSSPGVAEAVSELGLSSVEWKLDGLRIQVHRSGDDVTVYSRNLNDITARVPEVVAVARELAADRFVLDGEALALGPGVRGVPEELGRPRPFQESMRKDERLLARFFDCLHVDGDDLLDRPLAGRLEALGAVAGPWRIPGVVTEDPAEGEAVLAASLAAGHEGVVVKAVSSPYEAGRRGKAWRKVKVAQTLDLVVLGAEWGHGRRQGWLSNLHLGARAPDGGFVMVGKTFKGMTDETLRAQTARFLELETGRDGIIVWVRPEVVAEIALDGVQTSTRYPGGVALRFARLKRYREDKSPAETDTIETVRTLFGPPSAG